MADFFSPLPVLPSAWLCANIAPVIRSNHSYTRHAGLAFCLALACCALWAAGPVLAAPDSFVHGRPGLSDSGEPLTLSIPLSVDNEDALAELLRDGASIELKIRVIIERRRSVWFNARFYEKEFTSLVRHDPLSRDFRLTLPGGQEMQDKSLRALLSRSWKVLKLPLIKTSAFESGETYLVKAELSLKHAALPPWLDRTLVFWNKDVVAPASIELEYKVKDAVISR